MDRAGVGLDRVERVGAARRSRGRRRSPGGRRACPRRAPTTVPARQRRGRASERAEAVDERVGARLVVRRRLPGALGASVERAGGRRRRRPAASNARRSRSTFAATSRSPKSPTSRASARSRDLGGPARGKGGLRPCPVRQWASVVSPPPPTAIDDARAGDEHDDDGGRRDQPACLSRGARWSGSRCSPGDAG